MKDERNCRVTPRMMADHLGNESGSPAWREAARHIAGCPDCQAELARLEPVSDHLHQWREQPVPDWDRRALTGHKPFRWFPRPGWQWWPLAVSMALVVAVLLNVRIGHGERGWILAFGPDPVSEMPVLRPGEMAARPSMALSLDRDAGDGGFEQQLYEALCRYGASEQVPEGAYLAVTLRGMDAVPVTPDIPVADGWLHVLEREAMRACQRGEIDAVALRRGARRYPF